VKLEEQRLYLRNVVALARADDVIVLDEHGLLDELRQRIGASRQLFDSVLDELRPPSIDLSGLGRFSERLRCLEDLIELAFVDGDVPERERTLLFAAARDAGIDAAVMATLIREAQGRLLRRVPPTP